MMKERINKFLRRNDIANILIFLGLFFTVAYINWHIDNISGTIEIDNLINYVAIILSIIVSALLFFINIYIIGYFIKKDKSDLNWYFDRLKIYSYSNVTRVEFLTVWFIPIHLINIYLSNNYVKYYYFWLFLLMIVIGYLIVSNYVKNQKVVLVRIISNILFAILVFSIINFKKIGVYYMFWISRLTIFNEKFDGLDIYSKKKWEQFDNIVPSKHNYIEFYVHNFKDIFIFYLYPILLLIVLLNIHFFYAKTLKKFEIQDSDEQTIT